MEVAASGLVPADDDPHAEDENVRARDRFEVSQKARWSRGFPHLAHRTKHEHKLFIDQTPAPTQKARDKKKIQRGTALVLLATQSGVLKASSASVPSPEPRNSCRGEQGLTSKRHREKVTSPLAQIALRTEHENKAYPVAKGDTILASIFRLASHELYGVSACGG